MLIKNLRFISLASCLFTGAVFSSTQASILAVVEENANHVSNVGIGDYDSSPGTPGAAVSVIDLPSLSEKYRLYTFDLAD